MNFQPAHFYHVYNRGNNSQPIFFNRDNYIYFLRKIRNEVKPFCEILAYCLMPNHYHFLIFTKTEARSSEILPRKIGTLQSSYTQTINTYFNRRGSLFQQKAKAKLIDQSEDQLFNCFHYIHQNPYVAGLVDKLEDWEFSSYRDFAGLRQGSLVNYHVAYAQVDLPRNHDDFKKLSYNVINDDKIRGLFA